jgi:hypothetical protein
LDVSTLWDLFDYDSVSQKVSWRRAWHASSARRRFARAALMAGYFAAMFAAVASAYVSSVYGPGSVLGWVYGVFAAIAAMLGYLCLDRGDMLAVSVRVGDAWMNRINRAARRARTRQLRESA